MSCNWDQNDEQIFSLDPTVLEFQPESTYSDPALEAVMSSTNTNEYQATLEPWVWSDLTTSSVQPEGEVDQHLADNGHSHLENLMVMEAINDMRARLESVEAQGRNYPLIEEEVKKFRTALETEAIMKLRNELDAELSAKIEELKQWYGQLREIIEQIQDLQRKS